MQWVFAPPADLTDWVQAGVVLRADATLPVTRFPALTTSMLVVRIAGDVSVESGRQSALPASTLILPSTRFTRYAHDGAVHAVGLVLQASALACLLQGSAQGLANTHLCADQVLGGGHSSLVQALHEATDDRARLDLLFDAVRRRVADPRHESRRQQLQAAGQVIVDDLANASRLLGLGPRQLQRRCLAGFGLTPKQFQAISRMQATLRNAVAQPPARRGGGAELALRHGFYDQSHMMRDLRRLAGVPLRELMERGIGPATPDWPLAVGARFS